jgi:hypothetical protein
MGNIIIKAKKALGINLKSTNAFANNKYNPFSGEAEPEDDTLEPTSVRQIMDYIATYYILTMDFISLRKLYDKEYCDKLVILTSEIIEKYFTDMEISYLSTDINENLNKEKFIFINKDNLKKIDIQDPEKKKQVCNGIAKFYIKIAHVFATILTTINPVYTYKDDEGNTVQTDIYGKSKIPDDVDISVYKMNICDNRINALKRDINLEANENDEIHVHPQICSLNVKSHNKKGGNSEEKTSVSEEKTSVSEEKTSVSEEKTSVSKERPEERRSDELEIQTKSLEDEPGIPELMQLYYDDKYDYETGKFSSMSETSKKLFEENLQHFYKVFSNGKDKPEFITKFSDIKLRDFHNQPECQGENPIFERDIKDTFTNELFRQYAENIKGMIKKTNDNQEKLLQILNKLFAYTTDPQTKKKIIRVNPKLNEETLQEVILETREIVVKLYLTCENDFINGVKIYEAIIEQMILETAQNQIKTFQKMSDELVTEQGDINPAETKELELSDSRQK